MTYRLRIAQKANRDLNEAAVWYEEQEENLGTRFLHAADVQFDQVLSDPLRPRFFTRREVRRWAIPNWPYSIFYRMRGEEVRIIAVVHSARDPKYLNYRLR